MVGLKIVKESESSNKHYQTINRYNRCKFKPFDSFTLGSVFSSTCSEANVGNKMNSFNRQRRQKLGLYTTTLVTMPMPENPAKSAYVFNVPAMTIG